MSDRLLRDLGDLARSEAEEAHFDDRWDRLAAGTLTADEEAELKALAESSPEAREIYEAFRPLGADFQARVVKEIQKEQARYTPPPLPLPDPPLLPVLPFLRRAVRRVETWVGVAAAVAAGVFFMMRGPALSPLPGYGLDHVGVQLGFRGSNSDTATPGSLVTFTLRPETTVTGKVETRGFLSCAEGDLRPWPLKFLTATDLGIMTFQGAVGKDVSPGRCKIWVVAFRPGKAPKDFQDELRAGRTGTADWQAASVKLDVIPPR